MNKYQTLKMLINDNKNEYFEWLKLEKRQMPRLMKKRLLENRKY